MINDPSFRDLVAKHFAEQMIAKSIISPMPLAAAAAEPPLPPVVEPPLPPVVEPPVVEPPVVEPPVVEPPVVESPAAVELPPAKLPTLVIVPNDIYYEREVPRWEDAPDYIPLERRSSTVVMPHEIILSGKKRSADRSGSAASVSSFHEPLTARQLIQQALATSDPVPYSICMKLNSLRSKLIPYLRGYTLDDLKSIHIDTFLTHIIPYCYDIFVERRLSPNKLGVKLIPFGLHYYKYPTSRTLSVKRSFGVDSTLLDFIDNFAKEYIISTFLRIITDEENCRYYNYSVKVHPNWKKEITFCQIYSISRIDLDRIMEHLFDDCFSRI